MCREYDHFVRDCPNSREERDLEQLQHMLNMEEQDSTSLSVHSSDEDCRSPLNLSMVGMVLWHSYHWIPKYVVKAGVITPPTVGQYFTREQAKHIYKKVETGQTIM